MFTKNVLRLPKVIQQSQTSFRIRSSVVIGDVRSTPADRQISLCNRLAGYDFLRHLTGYRPENRHAAGGRHTVVVLRLADEAERVTRTMDRMLRANPHANCRPWRTWLVDNGVPWAGCNVFSGDVKLSTGMVRALDDGELMTVLGHEVAHFLIREELLWSAGPEDRAPTEDGAATATEPTATTPATGVWCLLRLAGVGRAVALAAATATTLANWREEHQADRMGVEMAVAAGVDPSAGRTCNEKLERIFRVEYGVRTWLPDRTHPSCWSRIWRMRRFEAEWKRRASKRR